MTLLLTQYLLSRGTLKNLSGALTTWLMLIAPPLIASESFTENIRRTVSSMEQLKAPQEHNDYGIAQAHRGWALTFDNDILVPGSRDQDYTYGLNIGLNGKHAITQWASLHHPLNTIDNVLGLRSKTDDGDCIHRPSTPKIEYGVFGFTPEDISLSQPEPGDRPYASLAYVSSSNTTYDYARGVSWHRSLTVGLLGTDIVGQLQREIHSLTDSESPQAWHTQISQGGELTARYTLSRHQLLFQQADAVELKSTRQLSIGYITEASWSIGGRIGKLQSTWSKFTPELANYGENTAPNTSGRVYEHFLWSGIAFKARAYNAFLQGQFRSNDYTYASKELHHGLIEIWLGYTLALTNGYHLSYVLRGHSAELKSGVGNRNVVWGGIKLARAFF